MTDGKGRWGFVRYLCQRRTKVVSQRKTRTLVSTQQPPRLVSEQKTRHTSASSADWSAAAASQISQHPALS